MGRKRLLLAAALVLLIAAGYFWLQARQPEVLPKRPLAILPQSVKELAAPGLTNFYQLTSRVFSGSTPDSDDAFRSLQERGVKTIISVEGLKPDAEAAKKFGMQYVHLPIGYGEMTPDQANRLVKAATALPGPVYVHCRLGLLRGPAGAAIVCMGTEGWNAPQAAAWLAMADTSSIYTGLYKSVAHFQPPSAAVLNAMPADFPESSEAIGLAQDMVRLDEHLKEMKLAAKAGFCKSPANPELDPADEASKMQKKLKELVDSPLIKEYNADFRNRMAAAAASADGLRLALQQTPADTNKAAASYKQMNQQCFDCHKEYRR
jgi:hypothetical protein